MDSIFSSRFVASEWIKQLPCGSGMEDCDFPEDALLPEIRPESQAEINVAEFLNIKRADDIHSEPSKSSVDNELNPCWQDIYDADCTMDSIFSARFVPSEWIKQLPCGSGMQDCDFPEDALLPEIRPESYAEINVTEFLNIKRADDSKLNP